MRLFREPPKAELLGGSSQLQTMREQLRRHLTRAELASAAAQLAILQEKLAGTSGPVMTERLRAFMDSLLGKQEVAAERVVAKYAELLSELKRIESLSLSLATVGNMCGRIDRPAQ